MWRPATPPTQLSNFGVFRQIRPKTENSQVEMPCGRSFTLCQRVQTKIARYTHGTPNAQTTRSGNIAACAIIHLLWPFPALRCVKTKPRVFGQTHFSPRCLQTCREPPISQFREATVEQKSKLETRDTLRTVQATSKRSKTKLMKKLNSRLSLAVFLDCKGGFHVEGPMLSSIYACTIYVLRFKTKTHTHTRDLVDSASWICLFQGLSHACLRITALQESAHGSLHQTQSAAKTLRSPQYWITCAKCHANT